MEFTQAHKMAAAQIVAAIVAQPTTDKESRARSRDHLRAGDFMESKDGEWLITNDQADREELHPGYAFWSPKSDEISDEEKKYTRLRLIMTYEERVARYALELVRHIERVAKLMNDGPIPD